MTPARDAPGIKLRPVATLTRRREFLRVRGGQRWAGKAFVIEGKPRDPLDARPPQVGYTVTKQVGNAPVRNRVRRRLREAMRLCDQGLLLPGHDYVLIGRGAALQRRFAALVGDLETALRQVQRGGKTANATS